MKYDWKGDYHEGLAKVKKGPKYGFIDENEKLVIPFKFLGAGDFSEGLVSAMVRVWPKLYIHGNGYKYGYFDKKGVMVIAPKFDKADNFSNGLARCLRINYSGLYIDRTGMKIFDGDNTPENFKSEIHQLPVIKTEEDAVEAVRTGGEASLYYVPDELKTGKVCMEAVKNHGESLRFVPEKLKTAELCMEAIKNSGELLLFEDLPDEFKNKDFLLEAIKHGYPIERAKLFDGENPNFKLIPKTEEMYYEAVKFDYYNMEAIPEEFWTYEMYFEAVKQFGNCLSSMPREFFTPEICLEAVKPNTSWRHSDENYELGRAIECMPEEFKTEEICLLAVSQNGWNLQHVPPKFVTKELCRLALYNDHCGFNSIPNEYLTEEWCYIAVKAYNEHFGYFDLNVIPEEFRTARVCLEAVKHGVWDIKYVPEELKTKELCLIAIKTLWATVNEQKDKIPADYWNDEIFCMEAVKQNFHALQCVPDKIKTKEFCLDAVTYAHDGMCIQYVPGKCRTEELCITALKKTPAACRYVPKEIEKLIRGSINRGLLPEA